MTILILLATYNGEAFLVEQIESLKTQVDGDWRLLVRDDGSTDRTCEILAQAARGDSRIEVLPGGGPTKGPAGNFAELLNAALLRGESMLALCDQDDVWMPEKLAVQRAELNRLARKFGVGCPLLVHGDLEVTDQALRPIHPSLMRFQLISRPADAPPLTLVAQNHVVGCSMLFNRALLRLAVPLPDTVRMHDWWLALCAEFAGVRRFLPLPLVRYRQHRSNEIGAKGVRRRLVQPLILPGWLRKMWHIHAQSWEQAAKLSLQLHAGSRLVDTPRCNGERLADLERFLGLRSLNGPARFWNLWRLGLRCQNPIMTLLYYAQAAMLSREGSKRTRG